VLAGVGELLIPIVAVMKRDCSTGGYIQAGRDARRRADAGQKGSNHRGVLLAVRAPGMGCSLDFEMTRGKQVAKELFKDYGGILHPPTEVMPPMKRHRHPKDLIHAAVSRMPGAGFIDAIKGETKAHCNRTRVNASVALMDDLGFAIDRQAREQSCLR